MVSSLCLVVDDEPDILELMVTTLTPMNIECYTAANVKQALEHLQIRSFDLCLTDMRLPDGNGIDLVTTIQQNHSATPVAVITAYGSVETAVQALKAGAFDYISKPIKLQELRTLVNTALRLSEQREHTISKHTISDLVGNSEVTQILRTKIEKLARSQAPVYICGESGSGKEVVAKMIHNLSARAGKPFVPVNCGAIPSELMESEFFGHKKGSFTGAHSDKPGLFQAAQGGTLFLDEVADLPLHMQVKLLRAIQEKQIRPVGAPKEIPTDIRVLSATHRDLAELVRQNKFRQDLFYRINVIELRVPPLRERSEDIPLLIEKILQRFNSNSMANGWIQLSKEAMSALKQYSFPGNVRELENIIERALTLCENNLIKPQDLQLPEQTRYFDNNPSLLMNEQNTTCLDPFLNNVERETILQALEQTNGNKTKAAKLLGISFGTLRYRLQKLKME